MDSASKLVQPGSFIQVSNLKARLSQRSILTIALHGSKHFVNQIKLLDPECDEAFTIRKQRLIASSEKNEFLGNDIIIQSVGDMKEKDGFSFLKVKILPVCNQCPIILLCVQCNRQSCDCKDQKVPKIFINLLCLDDTGGIIVSLHGEAANRIFSVKESNTESIESIRVDLEKLSQEKDVIISVYSYFDRKSFFREFSLIDIIKKSQ